MTRNEFIEKAKTSRIDFVGNVKVTSIWDGNKNVWYYGQYADKDGVHACPKKYADEIDCYAPISFDEIDDKTLVKLEKDIID